MEPLKSCHEVTNLNFINYSLNKILVHFNLSLFHTLYYMSIWACISCIIYDLGALEIA